MADSPEYAESFAEISEEVPEEWTDDIIILQIKTKDLDISKIQIDRNNDDVEYPTYEYHGIIPWPKMRIYND